MKISIVTITYNSEKTLEETINSVLNQNYDAIEYIIIDGLSTDGTLEIINKYRDRKIKVISEQDNGISDALNKGIAMASGDIVGIINSDDVLLKGSLKKVAEVFDSDESIDVLFGNCIRFVNSINDGYEVIPCDKLDKMKYSFLLLHPSIFVKRSAYRKYGLFKCEYKNAMDYELISRMYFAGAKFKYVNETFSAFREGGVSQTKFGLTIKEHKQIAKRNGGNCIQIYSHIFKLYTRRYILFFLKVIKAEAFFRKTFKHQRYGMNENRE